MDSKESANIFLLPNKFKLAGALLLLLGIGLAIMRFIFGIKPEFLNVKVFAIYSSMLQKKYFSFFTNHISEEISGILILFGLFFIGFSREKNEEEEYLMIRYRSIYNAVITHSIILLISLLFMYGLGFIYVLIINLYAILVLYITFYYYNLFKFRKEVLK